MRFTEDNGEVWQWVDDALTSNCQKLSTYEPTLIRTVLRSINAGGFATRSARR